MEKPTPDEIIKRINNVDAIIEHALNGYPAQDESRSASPTQPEVDRLASWRNDSNSQSSREFRRQVFPGVQFRDF